MVARLTPDQKAACSGHVWVISFKKCYNFYFCLSPICIAEFASIERAVVFMVDSTWHVYWKSDAKELGRTKSNHDWRGGRCIVYRHSMTGESSVPETINFLWNLNLFNVQCTNCILVVWSFNTFRNCCKKIPVLYFRYDKYELNTSVNIEIHL